MFNLHKEIVKKFLFLLFFVILVLKIFFVLNVWRLKKDLEHDNVRARIKYHESCVPKYFWIFLIKAEYNIILQW
jgi:hypothetical protein